MGNDAGGFFRAPIDRDRAALNRASRSLPSVSYSINSGFPTIRYFASAELNGFARSLPGVRHAIDSGFPTVRCGCGRVGPPVCNLLS